MNNTNQLNSISTKVFDNLLKALYHSVRTENVDIKDKLVEGSVACYPFGEVITINTPGENHPQEQIATKLADVICNGFSSIAVGETLRCVNCFSYQMGEAAKINIYRSKTDYFWSINSDKDGIIVLIRTYKDGIVDKMWRKYMPDDSIPADILEQLNEHL